MCADHAGYTLRNGKWVWRAPKRGTEAKNRYKAYKANPAGCMVNDKNAEKRSADIKARPVRWVAENADTVKLVVGSAAFAVCIVASTGACLIAGGVVIAAGIAVDAAAGAEMGGEYWKATEVTAGITLAGGAVGRFASGGGKRSQGGWFKSPKMTRRGPTHAVGRSSHARRTDVGPTVNAYVRNAFLTGMSCGAPAKSTINAGYCP
ncbi:hypothetical protein ABT389_28615 [Streptomyces bacillaris]|uniref:hypothetical protein n=1 Tax=Streptomyces bacillaris TaxID=68179 RepID=UPI00334A14C1